MKHTKLRVKEPREKKLLPVLYTFFPLLSPEQNPLFFFLFVYSPFVTLQRGETMDGALVGGAFLSSFLNVLFDRMASPQVIAFFRGQKVNDSSLLQNLKKTMTSLRVVLEDAEEKQITSLTVRDWLVDLKDAVYNADDFLDEIAYEALRQELEAEDQTFTGQTQKLLSFINPLEILGSREIEEKIEVLLQDLDPLVAGMAALGLNNRNVENPSSHRTPTTSLVDGSGVYGRDDDRKAILKLLLSKDANGGNPGVVPIRGMGGVGKTTLAQLVYNHRRVQKRFDLKAWVCVSEDFSVLKLTKAILEGFGSKPASDNLDKLQLQLKDRLEGKRFLLVLDDVWNEDYAEWDKLLTSLKYGAQGSKILVTTRNESVASVMRTVPTHHLKELTEDSCWSLFAKHAFRGENPNDYEELLEIGREIVRKCKGLPLAAKTLGGLLRTKRDVEEWEKILESNLWDLPEHNILPALRLSYHHLPSHLKQCFAYCAIFPKDHEFQKDELVLFWMAEGILVPSAVDDEMEKAGAMCFDDLLSRSFFQQSSVSRSSFVMHDLMHDLATHVSGQFCFSSRLGENNSSKATRRTRHFSLVVGTGRDSSSTKLENSREAQLLRTFQTFPRHLRCPPEIYNEIFQSTLGRLRVLIMSGCKDAAKMLCSTSKLKHLRYLDLSGSDLVTLPEEVSALLNLQTLILEYCGQLASLPDLVNLKYLRHLNLQGTSIERLPESLERLINLRYLNITGTPLKEMPPHIGQLTKLRTLTDFLVGRQSETSIKELGKLRHLRGDLHIRNLQNVVDARDAGEANLKGKKHLDKLRFTWDGDTHDPQHVTSTLEKLEPNRKLKDLQIDGYGGVRFPEWVGESSFSKIVSLKLSGCTNCTSLPPLGQLASLEDLSIEGFYKVVTVGSEFYGSCTAMKKPFESLKTLSFRRMPEWREWISDEGSREAFPLLDVLLIAECPKLVSFPKGGLPAPVLRVLRLQGCRNLKQLPESMHSLLPSLTHLGIYGCSEFELCPEGGFPSTLQSLEIYNCNKLIAGRMQWGLQTLPSLSHFTIGDDENIESFPEEMLLPSSLTYLHIHSLKHLKSLDYKGLQHLTSLTELTISNCPLIESMPEEGLPSSLSFLFIYNCLLLKSLPRLQHLTSLTSLTIKYCPLIESMPEEGLPSSLSFLFIYNCPLLKSLPRLQHLTSLRDLRINNCPLIESMPEKGLPSSLSSLVIEDCPMLSESCEREKGKDWPKISHIPHIVIFPASAEQSISS